VNKQISNIQRFLTLLFTDKDLCGQLSHEEEKKTPKKTPIIETKEIPVSIQPEDI